MGMRTAVEAQKKADTSFVRGGLWHTAVRPVPEHEAMPYLQTSNMKRDFSQIRPQTTTPLTTPASQTTACPIFPRRCPFGGACHTCPPQVQTKLTINEPGDKYEQEADRIAGLVMRMPEAHISNQVEPQKQEQIKATRIQSKVDEINHIVQRQEEETGTGDQPTTVNIQIQRDEETDQATLGTMTVGSNTIQTLELPNRTNAATNNSNTAGRIPAGTYQAHVRTDGQRGWRLELENVPGRTNIQIHVGNTPNDSTGCILPGTTRGENSVNNSVNARNQIRDVVDNAGANTTIQVTITDPPAEVQTEAETTVQQKRDSNHNFVTSPGLEARISKLNGHGSMLPRSLRRDFESRFGSDFRNVRIHTDTQANEMASQMKARAFTTGQNIVFGSNQYSPETTVGKHLLAHELTHVVQQDRDTNEATSRTVLSPDRLETEANKVSLLITNNRKATVSEKASGNTIQLQPRGTLETSRGVEEIEGEAITSSSQAVHDRLATQEGNINVQIQSWTEDGVGDLRDGIQEAAFSFRNWYASRARKPNTAAFISNLVWAIGGALSAIFPPASAAAVAAGVIAGGGGVVATILGGIDPNVEPDAQVLKIEQNMIRYSSTMDRSFDNFGIQLKTSKSDIWNSIGIAMTMDPPLLQIAQGILYERAGIPHPNRPYAEQILSKMIYTYIDWEKMWNLRESTFFISSESVEYSLFTNDVRRRLRREAEAEAQRRLGNPKNKVQKAE